MKKFISLVLMMVIVLSIFPYFEYNAEAESGSCGVGIIIETPGSATMPSPIPPPTSGGTSSPNPDVTQTPTPASDFKFDASTGTITKYVGAGGDVVIPSEINGVKVTCIGFYAFSGNDNITCITMPDSVQIIEKKAFNYCPELANIYIPYSVFSIGEDAFGECEKLTQINVDEKNNIYKSIDGVLFDKSGATFIRCPGGLSGSYIIPNSVCEINEHAFDACKNLTDITIPFSVTTIAPYALGYCLNLNSFNVDESSLYFKSINGVLYDKNVSRLIQYPCNLIGDYNIPESVTSISLGAFERCKKLTSICVPQYVTKFPALFGCSSLISINVDEANQYYSSLDGVLFDKNKTILIQCPNGKSGNYRIPDSVTELDEHAFYRCVGISSLNIPSSVIYIYYGAFGGCLDLTINTTPNTYADQFAGKNNIPVNYLTNDPNINIPKKNIISRGFINAPPGASTMIVDVTGIINPKTDNKKLIINGCEAYYTECNGVYKYVARVPVIPLQLSIEDGTPKQFKYGDATLDGEVNVYDLQKVKSIILGRTPVSYSYDYLAADVDGNGEVNIYDVTLLKNYMLGRINTLPAYDI